MLGVIAGVSIARIFFTVLNCYSLPDTVLNSDCSSSGGEPVVASSGGEPNVKKKSLPCNLNVELGGEG